MTTLEFIRQYPDKWKFASELAVLYACTPEDNLTLRSVSDKMGIPTMTLRRRIEDSFWYKSDTNLVQEWYKLGTKEKIYHICKSMFYIDENFQYGTRVVQEWYKSGTYVVQNSNNPINFETISNIQNDLNDCISSHYGNENNEETQEKPSDSESSDENSKKRKEPKEKNIIDNIVENNNININNNIFKKNSIITSSDKSSEDNNASKKSSQASPAPVDSAKVVKDKLTLPPPMQDVTDYFTEKGHPEMAEQFYDFYQSVGWMVGKNKMKDLKATIRNWIRRSVNFSNPSINTSNLSVVSPVVKVSQAAVRDLESDAELMAKVDASIEKINPNAVTPDTRHFLACMIDRFPYAFTKGVPITEKAARFYANKVSKEYFIEVLQDIEDNKPEFNNLGLYLHSKLGS